MPPKYSPQSVSDHVGGTGVTLPQADSHPSNTTATPATDASPATTTIQNSNQQSTNHDDNSHHPRRHPHSDYVPSPPPSLHHSHELLEVAIVRLLGSFRNYAGRHPDAVDMIENLPQATEFVSRFVAAYASTEGLHSVLDHRAAAGVAPSDNGQYRYYNTEGVGTDVMMMSNSNRSNMSNPNQQHEHYFNSSFEQDHHHHHRRRSPSPAYNQLQHQHQSGRGRNTLGSSCNSSNHHGPTGTPPTAPLKSPSPHVKCRVPAANLHLPPNLHLSECLPRDSPMSPPLPRPSLTSTPRASQARDDNAAPTPGGSARQEATPLANNSFNSNTAGTTPRQQQLQRITPRRNSTSKRSSNPSTPQQGSLQQQQPPQRRSQSRPHSFNDGTDMSPEMIAQLITEVEASILAHDEGMIAMAASRLAVTRNAATAATAAANRTAVTPTATPTTTNTATTATTTVSHSKNNDNTQTSTTAAITGDIAPAMYVFETSAPSSRRHTIVGDEDLTVSKATTASSSATPSPPPPPITFSGGGDVEDVESLDKTAARKTSPSFITTATITTAGNTSAAAPIVFAGEERDFATTTAVTTVSPSSPPAKKPSTTTTSATKNTTKSSCSTISSHSLGAIATGAAESFLNKINMDREPAAARAVTTAKAAAAAIEFDDDDLENDIPKLDVENIKFLINALKPLSTEVLEEICYEWGNLPAHGRRARRKYRLRGDRLRRQQLASKFPTTTPATTTTTTTGQTALQPHLRSVSETKQEETEVFEGSDFYSSTTSKTTTDSFRFSQLSDFEGKEDIDMCTVSFSSLLDSEDSMMKRLRAPVAYNAYHDDEDLNYHMDYGFEDVDVVSEGSSEGVQRKGIIIMPKTGIIPTTAAERIKKRRAARKAAKESTMTKAEIRKASKAKRERRDRRYFQEAIGQRIRFLAVNLLVTTCISFQRETGRKLLVTMDVDDSHEQQQIFTDAEIDDMLFSVCHILANDTRDSSLCVLASSFGLVNVTSVNRLPAFMPNLIICMGLLALLQPLPQLLLQRILVELNVHTAQLALLASAKDTATTAAANAKRSGMTRTQQRAQETAAAEAALQEARRLESAIEPMSEESITKAKAAAATLYQEGRLGGGREGGNDGEDDEDVQDMPLLPMGGYEDVADDFKERYCYPIATRIFPSVMKSPMLTDLKSLPINSKLSVFESSISNYSVQISSYVHTHFVDRQRLVSEPFTCKLYPMVEEKKGGGTGGKNNNKGGGGAVASSGGKKGVVAAAPSTSSSFAPAASVGPSSSGVKGKLEKIKFRAECVISGSCVSFRLYHRAPPLSVKSGEHQQPSSASSRRALHVVATVMTNVKKGNNNHASSASGGNKGSTSTRGGKGGGPQVSSLNVSSKSSSIVVTKEAILYAGERLVFDDFIPADAAGGIDGAGCGAGGGAAARGAEFYDVSTDMLSFKLNLEILDDCTEVVAHNRLEVVDSSTGTTPSLSVTNSPAPQVTANPTSSYSSYTQKKGGGAATTADQGDDDEDDLPPLLLGADRTTNEVDGAVNNLMSKLQKSGGPGGGGGSGSSLLSTALNAAGATSATSAGLGGSGSSSHVNTASDFRKK